MLGAHKGRWQRELTDRELLQAFRRPDLIVVEWEWAAQTFLAHRPSLVILRSGMLGGDIRVIHGGWKYPNDIAWLLDWSEIVHVGRLVRSASLN